MGITQRQISELRDSISVGDRFEFRRVTGRVYEKHRHFVVIERDEGYRECFKWIDMLLGGW